MENFCVSYDLSKLNNLEGNVLLGDKNFGCIFCNKAYDVNYFSDEAHAVPAFLNNTKLISLNECNDCNHTFSKIEENLANYLGVDRSLYSIKGRKKIPTFEINSLQKITYDKKSKIPIVCLGGDAVILNSKEKESIINYKKDNYSNTGVFKCLTKMALSLMPLEKIDNFKILREFVLQGDDKPYPTFGCSDNINHVNLNFFMKIKINRVNNVSPRNSSVLYLKNTSITEEKLVFLLYVGDIIMQIFVPSDFNLLSPLFQKFDKIDDSYNKEKVYVEINETVTFIDPAEITFIPAKFTDEIMDCSYHQLIEGESDRKVYGHSHQFKLDHTILKLDGKGGLEPESVKNAIGKLIYDLTLGNYDEKN